MQFYSTGGVIRSVPAIKSFWGNVLPMDGAFPVSFPVNAGGVLGWGIKPSAVKAATWAEKNNLPLIRLEDGFIRSVGLGVNGDPALSLYVDPVGIYYDATRPSAIENILSGSQDLSLFIPTALDAIDKITRHGISKFNEHTPHRQSVNLDWVGSVLVVDQTAGDLSVQKGLATAETFRLMLDSARKENPGKRIIIRRHPDVVAGKKQGYLDGVVADERTTIVSDGSLFDLFSAVDKVYVVTSLAGFEALMMNKPVTCFGAPFYAGWGVTDDRQVIPRRGKRRSVVEIFAAAYLMCCRYVNPVTWSEGTIGDVIEHILLQREMLSENAQYTTACQGLNWRKKRIIAPFLKGKSGVSGSQKREIVWGRGASQGKEGEVWRAEDGFIRSVGLGSNLVPPLSLVFDRLGIYYDATRPSDLEHILTNHLFDDALLGRAASLRRQLVNSRLSKYNLNGVKIDLSAHRKPDVPVLLVVGQVANDASILLGKNGGPANDYELMVAVRAQHPAAFVVYKPHPDVVVGNRAGKDYFALASGLADITMPHGDIIDLICQSDEIHTITSLTGFEALIRGKRVVCHGMPFYAGWGLTKDLTALPEGRRGRLLTVDQLVAGALILYPRYIHPMTGDFIGPEGAISILLSRIKQGRAANYDGGWLVKQVNKLKHISALVPKGGWGQAWSSR